MKRAIGIFLMFLIAGMCIALVRAEQQPTQQYNKIFLSPFYVENLVAGNTYNFTANINPPDKVSSIVTAIISFNAQINGQSQNFTLLVNNQSCVPSSYYIATAFSTTGNVQFSFDCSNRINVSGRYNITLKSAVNTGSISGWMDLTYQNNPKGTLDLFGTEYFVGQQGKLWLQLLDANRSYITSGVCYLDVYTPTNTQYVEGAVMTNMLHDGIYYYDFNPIPETEGVYPAIAKCYYSVGTTYHFGTTIQMINGTLDGGSLDNTQVLDGSYMLTTESPAGVNPRRYWAEINFSNGGRICNTSELLLSGILIDWTGRWNSNVGADDITISIYNYSSSTWINLSNKIIGAGTGVKTVSNSLLTTNLTKAGLVNSTGSNLRLRFLDTNVTDTASTGMDYDYLSVGCIELLSPVYEEVKGSSEMHISNPSSWTLNITSTVNETNIANTVWNTTNRNLTYYPDNTNYSLISATIWNYSGTVSNNILSQFANSIWSIFNSTYNFISLITESVWTRANRNLTYYEDVTNYTKINSELPYYVWNYSDKQLTQFNFDVVNESQVAEYVWGYINRSLTQDVAYEVWNYAGRNLTYEYINNISAQEIWEYVNRSLTSNDDIAQAVWVYNNRTLTYYELSNLSASDIWNYANRNLTQDVSGEVWAYANKTLTYYPDVTNYTLINDGVWNNPVRNLTYYPDNTINYTAISDAVWTNLNRSLTEFNFDVVNESEISDAVWSNINRTLTEYPELNETQIANAVWNSVSRNLTYYEVNNLSAENVWNYASRNLTYEQVNNLSAQEIWEYTTRELTYYPAINFTLENVTTDDIAEAVWNYNGTIHQNILSQFSEKVLCVIQNLLNQNNEDWGVDISVC